MQNFKYLLILIIFILFFGSPVYSARDTNSYDGNIFPIYAGNGSIVPPQTTLEDSIKNKRVALLFFYLDDSSDSKTMAPVISGLDLIWRENIDIIALTTDELQGRESANPTEASFYWNGLIPQTVVIDDNGILQYEKTGIVDIDEINQVIGEIKGLEIDESSFSVESFNEYNSRISKKEIMKKD